MHHETFITLLQHVRLAESATCLLNQYLTNQSRSVLINNLTLEFLAVNLGVPQESILDSLLYSVYTSVLINLVEGCSIHVYADDTQVYYSLDLENWLQATQRQCPITIYYDVSCQLSLKINLTKSAVSIFVARRGSTRNHSTVQK